MDENNDVTTFEQLGVAPELLKAINELGFEHPMPIQEMVIPHLLDKEGDVIGLAQTGTGKTAAFGLPLLQRIDSDTNQTQALIIAPTRELCLQTSRNIRRRSEYYLFMEAQASSRRSAHCEKGCKSSWPLPDDSSTSSSVVRLASTMCIP